MSQPESQEEAERPCIRHIFRMESCCFKFSLKFGCIAVGIWSIVSIIMYFNMGLILYIPYMEYSEYHYVFYR